MVERAVEAAWPAARTQTQVISPAATEQDNADDAGEATAKAAGTIIRDRSQLAAGSLRLGAPGWFPLRTDFDADPLRALLGAASTTGAGETAAVQVLARPAGGRAVARCRRAAREMRGGRPARRGLRLLDVATPGRTPRPGLDPSVGADVRAILAKADSPLWEVAVRYAVAASPGRSGGTESKADVRPALRGRSHAPGGFHQSGGAAETGHGREKSCATREAPRVSYDALTVCHCFVTGIRDGLPFGRARGARVERPPGGGG